MEEKEERKIYFDFLRIFATFAVIILHVSAQNWHTTDINSFEWNIFNFYDSIVRWGVPIFVMISGALFLNKNQSIKKIYTKNILRIIIAFIFWSLIYTVLFSKGLSIKTMIINFFEGYYHMWFLFMIVGLYMITPFVKKIIENELLIKYFIILSLIFCIIIPQAISIISVEFSYLGYLIQELVDKINLHMVLGYTLYYILGYYLDKININKKTFKLICFFGLIGFIATIILSILITKYTQEANILFYGNFTINVLLEAIFIFVIFKKYFEKIELKTRTKNVLYKLSKYSFGAYLVHIALINFLDTLLNLNTLTFNSFISVPVISIVVFFISFCISAIINHIPILNKYIV